MIYIYTLVYMYIHLEYHHQGYPCDRPVPMLKLLARELESDCEWWGKKAVAVRALELGPLLPFESLLSIHTSICCCCSRRTRNF
jgi:hypothetical protein